MNLRREFYFIGLLRRKMFFFDFICLYPISDPTYMLKHSEIRLPRRNSNYTIGGFALHICYVLADPIWAGIDIGTEPVQSLVFLKK